MSSSRQHQASADDPQSLFVITLKRQVLHLRSHLCTSVLWLLHQSRTLILTCRVVTSSAASSSMSTIPPTDWALSTNSNWWSLHQKITARPQLWNKLTATTPHSFKNATLTSPTDFYAQKKADIVLNMCWNGFDYAQYPLLSQFLWVSDINSNDHTISSSLFGILVNQTLNINISSLLWETI